jgi:hypothetical protein
MAEWVRKDDDRHVLVASAERWLGIVTRMSDDFIADHPHQQYVAHAELPGGQPSCTLHPSLAAAKAHVEEVTAEPTTRMAQCSCGKVEPSSRRLAFLVDRGPGSRAAAETCAHCHYTAAAHERVDRRNTMVCDHFEAHGPFDYDAYYCGCRGWD